MLQASSPLVGARRCFVGTLLALSLLIDAASAQLPVTQLLAVSPQGGRQGTSLDLKLTAGVDQEGVDRLLFSHPGITAKPKVGEPPVYGGPAEPIPGTFVVTIAADVPPGVYDLRAVGRFGVSNPRAFVVSNLPEVSEEPGNNSAEKAMVVALGSVVNGTAAPTTLDYFKFAAKKGQRVLADVWAQRIDSRMDASLVLFDATGREVARSRDVNRRDPLVDYTAAADGEYILAVSDFLFTGGPEHGYRLELTAGPHVDFIFPPAGIAGAKSEHTVYGRNLPGSSPAPGIAVDGRPLEKLTLPIEFPGGDAATGLAGGSLVLSREATIDGWEYRLKTPAGTANPYLLSFASAPIVVEQEPNTQAAKAQRLTPPCEVVGQFYPRNDLDWFTFDAKKGAVLWIEVTSQRLGLPTDPALVVQRVTKDAKGVEQVADMFEGDDDAKDVGGAAFTTTSGDPTYRFQAPDDGTYRVLVRDLNEARDDPRNVYRLAVREAKPDFRLVAVAAYPTAAKEARPWSPLVRRGGTEAIEVSALRRDGFDEPIEIAVEGLPEGVTCRGATLGPGQESTAVVLVASETAKAWTGPLKIVGRAKIGDREVKRMARSGATLWAGPAANQPNTPGAAARLTNDLLLAVCEADTVPVLVEAGGDKPLEICRAGKLEVPIKVTRRAGYKEALTLTAFGLPAAIKPQPVTIAAGANDGKLVLDIPVGMPLSTYSVYFKAPTKFSYGRDAAGAALAAEAKKQVDKLAADAEAAAKAAVAAKPAADKAVQETAAAAAKAPEAEKTAAAAKAKDAVDKQAAAAKAITDTAAKLKAVTAAKAAADKKATDLAAAAKPKDVNTAIASTLARFTVTAAPVALEVKAPTEALKKGAQAELPVALTRLYNYAENVDLEVVLPGSLKDVKATAAAIPKGKNDGKIVLAAGPAATPGSHAIVVRAKPKLNNQTLTVEQTFTLKVE